MSTKNTNIILVLMLLTICGLFVTQAYWFKKSFDLQDRQLDDKMNVALRNVAHQLLMLENDSTSTISPVTKVSSNEYFVKTSCFFSLTTLDSSLKKEFLIREIEVNFDYLIFNSGNKKLKLGNTILNLNGKNEVACKKRNEKKEKLDFKIRINNKTSYLLNSLGIWMYSSLSLLLLLGVFTFIIISIIKGKKLTALKTDFINNMTHELKTPIANILVASDVLRNKNINLEEEKFRKYAEIIYKENNRLHGLVDKVLQISSMENKEESLVNEKVDLKTIITEVLESFEPIINKNKGQITTSFETGNLVVLGDKTHLTNVFYNLIDNAIKYSGENPEITIKIFAVSNGISIEISDKGIGIKKENEDKIFDKFFREETGNLHNTKGFGLGLSYVKMIIEKHKGTINLESKETKGSKFTLFLPQ